MLRNVMKAFFMCALALFSGGVFCILAQELKAPDDIALKIRQLVELQDVKPRRSDLLTCPADLIRKGRRSRLGPKDCERDPQNCLAECDKASGDSCQALARLVQDHTSIDSEFADVLYRKACGLGITLGCTNAAAKLFTLDGDQPVQCPARTFEKTCTLDDAWGCTMFGMSLALGRGVPIDKKKALLMLDKACTMSIDKSSEACVNAKQLKDTILKQKSGEKDQ